MDPSGPEPSSKNSTFERSSPVISLAILLQQDFTVLCTDVPMCPLAMLTRQAVRGCFEGGSWECCAALLVSDSLRPLADLKRQVRISRRTRLLPGLQLSKAGCFAANIPALVFLWALQSSTDAGYYACRRRWERTWRQQGLSTGTCCDA